MSTRRNRGLIEATNRLDDHRAIRSERPRSVTNASPLSFNATPRFAFRRFGSRDVAPTVFWAQLDGSNPARALLLAARKRFRGFDEATNRTLLPAEAR